MIQFFNRYIVYSGEADGQAKDEIRDDLGQGTTLSKQGLTPGTKYKFQLTCLIKAIELPGPMKVIYASTKLCQSEFFL